MGHGRVCSESWQSHGGGCSCLAWEQVPPFLVSTLIWDESFSPFSSYRWRIWSWGDEPAPLEPSKDPNRTSYKHGSPSLYQAASQWLRTYVFIFEHFNLYFEVSSDLLKGYNNSIKFSHPCMLTSCVKSRTTVETKELTFVFTEEMFTYWSRS